MKISSFLCVFYITIFWANHSFASALTMKDVAPQVEKYLRQKIVNQRIDIDTVNVKVKLRNINQHLKLSQCDKPLTLELQSKIIQRNATVKVSCESPKSWSLFVGSTIALEKPIIVARYELPRHHIINKDDLVTVQRDIYTLRTGYTNDVNDVIGKELKRAMRSGDIVYSYNLRAPDIIKKGDLVTLIIKRGSLSVSSPGIALSNASAGEKLRVENQRSSRIVHARVIGPSTAEVF